MQNFDVGFPTKISYTTNERTPDGKFIEYGHRKNGEILKTSIFIDRNKDGKYTKDEVVSVKYSSGGMSSDTCEYIDEDNDGCYDKIIISNPWEETIIDKKQLEAEDKELRQSKERRSMEYVYWDSYTDSPRLVN